MTPTLLALITPHILWLQVQPIDPMLDESIRWYTGVAGMVDDARAHDLMLAAAADEDPISTMWLARCYGRGRMLFEADEARARMLASEVIEEIAILAQREILEAVFLMGTAHDEALGVAEDPIEAAEWYRRAAGRGHVLAQHNLGNAYAAGRGVPQSDSLAVHWWRRAAEQGDAIAQLRLGEMYEVGRGIEQSLDSAVVWYRDSAERGNSSARDALERIGRRLRLVEKKEP